MSFEIHIGPNLRKSPYFEATVADGVRSFSVYNHMYIPGNFGDPDAEYQRLISGVVMWDVAAERQVEICGRDASKLVQLLTTRDISGMQIGQGRYVLLCAPDGTLINDPVLLKLGDDRYWLSIADSDVALWAGALAEAHSFDLVVREPDASPLAIQGPKAERVACALFGDWVRDIKYFWFRETHLDDIPILLARSGWSKQGGFELYLLDQARGTELWERVRAAGGPFGIGPGAPNDIERIESGLVSYGADMRREVCPANPYEMGLGHLVDLSQTNDFVGRTALEKIYREGPVRRRTGIFLDGPQIRPNPHPLPIVDGQDRTVGTMSECVFSPRLERNIGLALVNTAVADDAEDLAIHHDERLWPVSQTELPFIQPGAQS